MGLEEDVLELETALRRQPLVIMEYHHMSQQDPPMERPFPQLPDDFRIRVASTKDVDTLSGIQRLYEIEEVLLPGNTFNAAASRRHLAATLRSQLVLVGESRHRPIAKAGTNARGLFFDQIGGVFTLKDYRSRGVSSALMMRMLAMLQSQKKGASLFVKPENGPALSVYRNLGFGLSGCFRISYFR